jgi:hypothetical protein
MSAIALRDILGGRAIMADEPVIDQFKKTDYDKSDVERIRQRKLNDGATSSEISQDGLNWILTTVWPGGC